MRFKIFSLVFGLFLAVTNFGCDSQSSGGGSGNGTGGLFVLSVIDSQNSPVSGLSVFVRYGSCANAGSIQNPPVAHVSPIRSVELDYFFSEVNGDVVTLFWGTLTETNNAGFEVQTQNGGDWNALGFVGGEGTTQVAQDYSYSASGFGVGTHTFRLKQIDFDGAFEYSSEIAAVVGPSGPVQVNVAYPNPFHFQTQLSFAVDHNQSVGVTVHDLEGTLIQTLFSGPVEGNQLHLVTWDPGSSPAIRSGIYRVRISAESASDSISVAYNAEPMEGSSLLIGLGVTDTSGFLRVDDRTRFPSLFGVEPIARTDEVGNRLGSIDVTNDVTIIRKDKSGLVRRYQRFINSDHNSFDLVWQ